MNNESKLKPVLLVYFVAIVGTFLLMGIMVRAVRNYIRPAPLNIARAEERRKALAEVKAQAHDQLESYGWIDQGKGVVRLPVSQAIEMVVKSASNPAAARSSLLARVEKANPPPPPPVKFE